MGDVLEHCPLESERVLTLFLFSTLYTVYKIIIKTISNFQNIPSIIMYIVYKIQITVNKIFAQFLVQYFQIIQKRGTLKKCLQKKRFHVIIKKKKERRIIMINILFWMFIWMAIMEDVFNLFMLRKQLRQYKKGLIRFLSIKSVLYIIVISTHFLSSIYAFIGIALYLAWQIFALIYEEVGDKDNLEPYHVFRIISMLLIIIIIYLL